MSAGEWAALALLLGGFAPGAWIAARGAPRHRLVGLEFSGVAATLALSILAIAWQQPASLIVPLVLAVITFPGTLVYTRLLARKP